MELPGIGGKLFKAAVKVAIVLRVHYAMSGTDIAYGATGARAAPPGPTLSAYARAMRCPVLR
eukprot:1515125-Rhodomonas_salina.1